MNCMKCGRETEAEQIFCESCLEEMEKYPVRPNTVVQIPNRVGGPGSRKTFQRRQTPEEQVAILEKRCRRLFTTWIVTLLMLAAMAIGAGLKISELDVHRFIGQNYTSSDTPAASDASNS